MKTASETPSEFPLHPEAQDQCAITVVYEDTDARQRALGLSHHLVQAFWAEIDFEFSWWRFRFLHDSAIGEAAAQAAAEAHVVVFSASSSEEPSAPIQNWIESWVPRRTPGEGVLLVLTPHTDDTQIVGAPIYNYLRSVARRAQMDCLPHLTPDPWGANPQSLDQIETRAHETTRVLDSILRQGAPSTSFPSHWGINE
jgi:hypothetical protein